MYKENRLQAPGILVSPLIDGMDLLEFLDMFRGIIDGLNYPAGDAVRALLNRESMYQYQGGYLRTWACLSAISLDTGAVDAIIFYVDEGSREAWSAVAEYAEKYFHAFAPPHHTLAWD